MSKSGTATPGLRSITSQVQVDQLNITSILSNRGITINVDHEITQDEAKILALGYKQEFKREFSMWSIFAVSFSVLGLLPSIAACFEYQQLVIGISPIPWLLAVFFIISVALSMAEVASAFPTSAGTPYAVSQLAPKKWAPFATWMTCFANWMCQITAMPSVDYSCASLMLAIYAYNSNGSYSPTSGQVYGLTSAIQISHAIICSCPTKWLAKFNSVSTSINMIFLIIVFVCVLAGNKRQEINEGAAKWNDNAKAWGLYNQTDYPNGMAMLMSFLGVIWAMSGYDSPFHLAEECSNASIAAPRAIVLTATVGGLIGWIFMIAIAYTVYDIDMISQDPQGLGQPFMTYLTQILDRKLVLCSGAMTAISSWFMGCSCLLAASRVTFSYSRDGLFPMSRWWKRVHPTTKVPMNAVWINTLLGQLFLLLLFAGDTAIGAVFSVGGIAGFVSFTMPTLFKITCSKDFQRGPWHLGRWSTPIGCVSIAFVIVMIPVLCFPTVKGANLTPDTMNWTVVVFFGPLLIVAIWWFIDARKWYIGPRSNIDEADLVFEDEAALDGIEVNEKRHEFVDAKLSN